MVVLPALSRMLTIRTQPRETRGQAREEEVTRQEPATKFAKRRERWRGGALFSCRLPSDTDLARAPRVLKILAFVTYLPPLRAQKKFATERREHAFATGTMEDYPFSNLGSTPNPAAPVPRTAEPEEFTQLSAGGTEQEPEPNQYCSLDAGPGPEDTAAAEAAAAAEAEAAREAAAEEAAAAEAFRLRKAAEDAAEDAAEEAAQEELSARVSANWERRKQAAKAGCSIARGLL